MDQRDGPELTTLLGLGAATAAILVVGLGLGLLLDRVAGTLPVFTLVGLALGILAAGIYLYTKFAELLKR